MPVLIKSRGGLGDAIYLRPFVRRILDERRGSQEVYVETSWPWMFSDLPVKPVIRLGLDVQAYHAQHNTETVWHNAPKLAIPMSFRYRWGVIAKTSVIRDMEHCGRKRLGRVSLDLPPMPDSPLKGRKYAVVRPPMARLDFPGPAREPKPEYLATAAERLRAMGYEIATIGFEIPGLEEPTGVIRSDHRYEHGELSLPQACALVSGAAVVLTPPCWLLPFCLAAKKSAVVIAGGCGGRNCEKALVDPRIDTGLMNWLIPDDYCMCRDRLHGCPKDISDFDAKLDRALTFAHARAA